MKAPLKAMIMVGGHPEDWGFILGFLDLDDPRPAAEQINEHYVSGWSPFEGFSFDKVSGIITYSGDPPLRPLSSLSFRDELLLIYPGEWVLILQRDDTWQIARLD
jgi:hypothetical protein